MSQVSDSQQAAMDEYYSAHPTGYIGKQYAKEKEATRALCEFMLESAAGAPPASILDAGCGDGAMLLSVRRRFPQARLAGFDVAAAMVDYARKHLPQDIRIGKGDILDIAKYSAEKFDFVYSVHTLCLFPSFEEPTLQLMRAAKRHVFINSLFARHNVDMYVTVAEPGMPPVPWNVFSIKRFTDFAVANGAKGVRFLPFEMPFELPDPQNGMGSYTERLADGRHLTFSGPLFLPWHLARIDL